MTRIALIEDNPDNRLLLQAMIGDSYQLDEYATGPDGLAGLQAMAPDLVLLDISLPEMDGLEVLRRVRSDPSIARLPVVALTAHAMHGDRDRFLSAGFDAYVTKPILDESVLVKVIEDLLATRRS